MNKLSRRTFIRLSGVTAAGAVLAGCAPKAAPPAATATPAGTAAPAPTPTITPTPEPSPTPTLSPTKVYNRPDIIKLDPDNKKSRVVRVRSADVWKEGIASPPIMREMINKAIKTLTGIEEVKQAWLAIFKPEERIAIKVNAFRNSKIWTKPEMVRAVTDSLVEAGIPKENITIFDYYTSELREAGFEVNELKDKKDGLVFCYGTEQAYSTSWNVDGTTVRLSDILVAADAIINMPVLKSHMIAGMTFALKNHFGSVSYPDGLHSVKTKLAALNALPPIKDGTRLVIGDALSMNTKYSNSFPYWDEDARGDSILMSFDPLATDRVALDILTKKAEELGNSTKGILGMCDLWLDSCNKAGIGTCDPQKIEIVEV